MATAAASSEESQNLKHVCTQCYKAATKKCSACCGAPNADQSIVDTQWYCGTECQKADWINHKSACKIAQTRKMLYRAGHTLQMGICMYREELFDLFIESVERKDGDIVLVEGWYDSPDLFFPFPSSLFPDEDEKRAVLLHQCCDDAPAYMYKLILMMLQGKSNMCSCL